MLAFMFRVFSVSAPFETDTACTTTLKSIVSQGSFQKVTHYFQSDKTHAHMYFRNHFSVSIIGVKSQSPNYLFVAYHWPDRYNNHYTPRTVHALDHAHRAPHDHPIASSRPLESKVHGARARSRSARGRMHRLGFIRYGEASSSSFPGVSHEEYVIPLARASILIHATTNRRAARRSCSSCCCSRSCASPCMCPSA